MPIRHPATFEFSKAIHPTKSVSGSCQVSLRLTTEQSAPSPLLTSTTLRHPLRLEFSLFWQLLHTRERRWQGPPPITQEAQEKALVTPWTVGLASPLGSPQRVAHLSFLCLSALRPTLLSWLGHWRGWTRVERGPEWILAPQFFKTLGNVGETGWQWPCGQIGPLGCL